MLTTLSHWFSVVDRGYNRGILSRLYHNCGNCPVFSMVDSEKCNGTLGNSADNCSVCVGEQWDIVTGHTL